MSLECGAPAVAFDIHFVDGGVVNQAIDRREGHGGIQEDPVLFAEGLIGGDEGGTAVRNCLRSIRTGPMFRLGPWLHRRGRRGSAGDICRAWRWRIRVPLIAMVGPFIIARRYSYGHLRSISVGAKFLQTV